MLYVIYFLLSSCFIISENLTSSEFLIKGTFLSNRLTLESPIPKFTFLLLNVKLALCPRKNALPKFRSWERFLTTIGLIDIGCLIFSMTMKNGLTLPRTSTCCPATAVPAFKEQGETDKINCLANFSEQMGPKRFPLSEYVYNLKGLSMPV